jgi:hypothetical protein
MLHHVSGKKKALARAISDEKRSGSFISGLNNGLHARLEGLENSLYGRLQKIQRGAQDRHTHMLQSAFGFAQDHSSLQILQPSGA